LPNDPADGNVPVRMESKKEGEERTEREKKKKPKILGQAPPAAT